MMYARGQRERVKMMCALVLSACLVLLICTLSALLLIETSIHPPQRLPPRRIPLPILFQPLPHHRPISRSRHAPLPWRKTHMGQYSDLLQKVQWTERIVIANRVGFGGDGVEERTTVS